MYKGYMFDNNNNGNNNRTRLYCGHVHCTDGGQNLRLAWAFDTGMRNNWCLKFIIMYNNFIDRSTYIVEWVVNFKIPKNISK